MRGAVDEREARPRATRSAARRAAVVWSVIGIVLILFSVCAVAIPESRQPTWALLLFTAMAATLGIVGALIVTRQPRNTVGWILWVTAVATAVSHQFVGLRQPRGHGGGCGLPGTTLVAWLAPIGFFPSLIAIVIFIPLLFPDGRTPAGAGAGWAQAARAGRPWWSREASSPPDRCRLPDDREPGRARAARCRPVPVRCREHRGLPPRARSSRSARRSCDTEAPPAWSGRSSAGSAPPRASWCRCSCRRWSSGVWPLDAGGLAWLGAIISLTLIPDRDRRRDPPLPPVRDRPDHQPDDRRGRVVTGVLVAVFARAVVLLQAVLAGVTQAEHARRRRVHARRVRAVPAAPAAGPARRGPALRPRPVRRRADRRAFAGRLRDEVDLGRLDDAIARGGRATPSAPASTSVWLRDRPDDQRTQPEFRNDVRTPVREDGTDDCTHSPLPPPHRPVRRRTRRPSPAPAIAADARPSSPASPWTSPRPTRCSPTSSRRPARWT